MRARFVLLPLLLCVVPVGAAKREASQPANDPAVENSGTTATSVEEEPYQERSFWQRAVARLNPDPGFRLSFSLVREIPLPGPLPDGRVRLDGAAIAVNVPGGVALADWNGDGDPVISAHAPGPAPAESEAWAEDPAGRWRGRFVASGHLVTEKRCKSCKKVWKSRWKLRVPGSGLSIPLLTDDRIFFGAQDNRVYCLNKTSGNRLWVVDVEARVSGPPIPWQRNVTVEDEDGRGEARTKRAQVVLVLPDGGSTLVALDARSGREMARYALPVEDGRLLGAPVATPDGHIVIAREKYSATEASLLVLDLAP